MSMIEFDKVSKRFDDKVVLKGLSFTVESGEVLAIVGPSGTGKSVTLKHIVGLVEPDAGEVRCASDRIGYLFQSGALLAWLTVAENVALPLREASRLSDEEIDTKVRDALAAVDLTGCADNYPSEISGGMIKRASLARAIVTDSDVILYDEPTSGLDPITSAKIHRLIRELNQKRKITSILVTHDLQGALTIADRILLLSGGKAIACCPPAEFRKLDLPEVREFLSAVQGE